MDAREAASHHQTGGVARVHAGDDRIHEHRGGLWAEAARGEFDDRLAGVAALRAEGFGEQAQFASP